MNARLVPILALTVIAAGWGLTMPLTKIAVSTGYQPLGLIFWQKAVGGVLLLGLTLARGKRLSLAPQHLGLYAVIACLGTIFPNSASYLAAAQLPAGIMSIVVSLVPILAFPIAIAMGNDSFTGLRFLGLFLGLSAILLIALPEASLPDPAMVAWLPLALIAPLFYALEGNIVGKYGTFGLDPIQVLAGASILGAVLVGPAALATGDFIDPTQSFGPQEWAILGIALAHAFAYTGYVWLVGRAGAVFAAQVAYLVTGFGIFWSWMILAETYSGWVWAALLVMFAGLFLVQPRPNRGLQGATQMRQDGAT